MTQLDVHANLINQLVTFGIAESVLLANINKDFDPSMDTSYIKYSFIDGEVFQVQIDSESCNRAFVILQLDIVTEQNSGTFEAKRIVDLLQPYFKRGTTITNGTLSSRVTNFAVVNDYEEANKYVQSVRVTTRTDYPN